VQETRPVDAPREGADLEFKQFSDQAPEPQVAPATPTPQPQLPPSERSVQFNATDNGDAIRVERSAATGAQRGFQEGAGDVFATARQDPALAPNVDQWEKDFHEQQVAKGTEGHQRIFGDRPYDPANVANQSRETARAAAAAEAESYLATRQLETNTNTPRDPRVDRATAPYEHDNEVGAQVRDEYRDAAVAADRARLDAMRIRPGQTEDRGAQVTRTDAEDGTTRVAWNYPDGRSRTVDYRKDDPNYLRETVDGEPGERQTLSRDGTTIQNNGKTYELGDKIEIKRTDAQGNAVEVEPFARTTERGPDGSIKKVTDPKTEMTADERAYREKVLNQYNYTKEARFWMTNNAPLAIRRPGTEDGGGFAVPKTDENGRTRSYATINGKDDEAAIHELAHVWFDHKVNEKGFNEAEQAKFRAGVERLANDPDADPHMRGVAQDQLRRNPDNISELYAGLASGSVTDISRLPPYLRPYYADMFGPPK
jgi:hypothetical protein